MLPAALESPEASARFMREARAAGRLTSEHVCRVSDVGRFESGAPYIVMEYLEGYDLGTMLKKRGPLRVTSAVDYVIQACEGLAEAHAQGIVHRDLKPDNLYLSARADGGRIVKVLDFGISKAAVTGISTQTGDILGSPAYMAPEQMRSTKDVDARADVWSLGVVLYQLVTGRLPFSGDSLPNLCLAVMNDDPAPPGRYREELPDGLAEVIGRCLEKDLERRIRDVGELAAALAPFTAPGALGSVTRVQSALRGRPAPPDPSQTAATGFAAQSSGDLPVVDTVAPTLSGTVGPTLGNTGLPAAVSGKGSPTVNIGAPAAKVAAAAAANAANAALVPGTASELFAPRMTPAPPRPSGQRPVEVTTLAGSAGESVEMRAPRFPIGLVGALCGAIGLVVVLIVMVMRSGGGDGGGTEAIEPPKAVAGPGQGADPAKGAVPAERPKPEPIIEPIIEPVEPVEPGPGSGSASGVDHGADVKDGKDGKDPKDAKDPKGNPSGRPRTSPIRRLPKDGKDAKDPGKDGKDGKDPANGGSNAAPPDNKTTTPDAGVTEEDKWGRMQHDQPKGQGS
jgi:serine/threonine-protein kinase